MMWKESMVELRGLVEPNGKRAHRAAEIVQQVRTLPEVLSELKNIVQASGKEAHRVAELVSSLLDLPEWIDGEHGGLRDEAERELDRLCRMIALTIDELLAMVKHFPDPVHWDKADLCALRDAAVDKQRRADEERRAKQRIQQTSKTPGTGMSSNGRHPAPPATDTLPDERKVVAELASEFDHKLKERAATEQELRAALAKKDKEIARLHAKVAELQITVARLRKQAAKKSKRTA
jgi:hypothetical protein